MKESDEFLITQCLEGDKDAFGSLVSNYQNRGMPNTDAGEIGTYMPYSNDIGAGFRIVNTKTEDAWWTNGTDWGKSRQSRKRPVIT